MSLVASSDFLSAQPGDIAVIKKEEFCQANIDKNHLWVGLIIHLASSARNPRSSSLLQALDIKTGVIKTINIDLLQVFFRSKSEGS